MSDNDTDAKARAKSVRRFPAPWQVEQTPGGFKVLDASGQALVYAYVRETSNEAIRRE